MGFQLEIYTFLKCKENSSIGEPCSPGEDRGVAALIHFLTVDTKTPITVKVIDVM
jgi:hypothetical protein